MHTNCLVKMTFKPAPINYGFKFQRVDLEGKPIIPASAEYVGDTSRGTVIGIGNARVSTLEHSLAALTGMDLDNVLVEIDNEEVPILDGSSRFFVQAIEEVGVVLNRMPNVNTSLLLKKSFTKMKKPDRKSLFFPITIIT